MDITILDLISPTAGGGGMLLSIWLYTKVNKLLSKVDELEKENDRIEKQVTEMEIKHSKNLGEIFSKLESISGMISKEHTEIKVRLAILETKDNQERE